MKKILSKLEIENTLFLLLYFSVMYFALKERNVLDIMYALFLTIYFLRIYLYSRKKQIVTSC